jgi:hypothetical protein
MATLITNEGQWLIRDEWCEDDITDQCEQIGLELTQKEIRDVLTIIVKSHDCSVGINWDVINSAIQIVKRG